MRTPPSPSLRNQGEGCRPITEVIGQIPYRMALAGGWIDQPFVSRLNPSPPGSMVVAGLEPTVRYMDRAGMATGTRKVALRIWEGRLPDADPGELVRELYREENRHLQDPSGSQDMIGLVYPGICRLDYDYSHQRGIFPIHIECCVDPAQIAWLEQVLHVIPVAQRPPEYHPLGRQKLAAEWIRRLGESGRDCFRSILDRSLEGLGKSMNLCMRCWDRILPDTVDHPALSFDLRSLLEHYQQCYAGAMYSGCGGGYLYIAADREVPGAFKVRIRRR